MSRSLALLVMLAVLLRCLPARAHPLSPVVLTLSEVGDGEYDVLFRRSRASSSALRVLLPTRCAESAVQDTSEADRRETRYRVSCGRSLRGETVLVQGLVAQELSALVYVALRDGEPVRAVLSARNPALSVPHVTSSLQAFSSYFGLGVTHLAEGADHLLFVAGLCLLAAGMGALLWALSAFTLGHSVTLALSATGLLTIPAPLSELVIALSLLLLGFQIARDERRLSARDLSWFALVCGLVHGLGFASALGEAGLPRADRTLCLLGFNLGLECAQVVWVVALVGLSAAVLACLRAAQREAATRQGRWVLAHVIGGLSFMWCIERML